MELEGLDGRKVSIGELVKDKNALVFTWASWAPEDLRESSAMFDKRPSPKYNIMKRLEDLYKEYGSDPDVVILGISVDVDKEAARAFVEKHEMPWQNFLVPDDKRQEAIEALANGDVPNMMAISRRGRTTRSGIKEVLGYETAGYKYRPFKRIVEESRGAEKAGGYARHWLGAEVVDVLQNYDEVEVLALTGDHMTELNMAANATLPPPPGQFFQAVPAPTPIPKPYDMPTSIGVLVDYPIRQKGVVKRPSRAKELVKILLEDKGVAGPTGCECFPYPKQAVTFRRGADEVSVVVEFGDYEVFLNGDKVAWLAFTDAGKQRFEEVYQWLAKNAGLEVSTNHK